MGTLKHFAVYTYRRDIMLNYHAMILSVDF